MTENESEKTIIVSENADNAIACPFTQHEWKKIGDTLLATMFIVVPLILLFYFISMQM